MDNNQDIFLERDFDVASDMYPGIYRIRVLYGTQFWRTKYLTSKTDFRRKIVR